ncbi:MAG: PSD1 and planctomycete cytochrome C domain-containing protein [Verrucomicrobiota bacterium]
MIFGGASCFAATPIDFNREVRPILSDNCFACHGPDEKHRKAKLRLDIRDIATSTHDSVQAIKPKDLKSSEVWRRITTKDADDLMPPPESNKKLTSQQIDILRRWILEGAEYKGHWAWEAPVKISPPKIKNSRWAKNPIDNFIAAKLAEKKFAPEVEASKETLIRRVTFDLTGLPPTIEEVNAFLADKKNDAYERVVDRLLQSPRYGEQQARYWLDAVRYGDTHGLHLDNERSMWPYRDWVVEAFNKNLPFDKFTVWQIAGDLLPNATREQKVASGYNRCNISTSEGGAIDDEFYVRYAIDRTETTAVNWMALTAGCAVCHDHKFDPISQKEFYSLYAIFNNNNEKAMDGNALLPPPMLKLPSAEQEKEIAQLDREIVAAKKAVEVAVEDFDYKEPGPLELENVPEPREIILFDDEIPAGAKAPDIQLVTAENGKVFSGKKAIKRTADGLAQDVFETLTTPLIVGTGDKLFANIYIDPTNQPKAIMLQFKTTDWTYRLNWGDVSIPYGDKKPGKKTEMGALPKAGEWVRLEIETDKLEIKPGLRITGIAFTQFGGTVFWDKAGAVTALVQKDRSTESLWAWETHQHAENGMTLPKEISALIKKNSPTAKQKKLLKDYYVKNVFAGTLAVTEPLNAKLKTIQDKRNDLENKIPATMVFEEMAKPRGAFVLKRGEYDKRGDEVQPGTPKFLPALPQTEKTNRLMFANWLVATNHPLTSRVIVNRYWQQFFGVGLVKTSQDFGSQGEPPSHPELLDWLAIHFMESGWDIKAFHRLIVTSATYRQDSRVSEIKYQADPENRLLARGSRFRLDAEQIRDNALFLAGLLNEKMGGRAVRPYQPEGIWEAVAYTKSDTANYTQDHGDALYRRSLYTFWKRTAAPASMTTFDAPSREKYCVRRERTDTPLQALATMNDIQFVEAARHFGERMIKFSGDAEHRLEFGFRSATARDPSKNESRILKEALTKHLVKYQSDKEAAQKLISVGESPASKNVDASELAAYTMVASLLLNLDETLNKN